jgi:ribonuclease P protein component
MTVPSPQTLGRDKRLKSRKRIAALFSQGERLQLRLLRVHHLTDPGRTGGVKVGFGASARVFRRAVDRNRIKRLMREAWRRQAAALEVGCRPGPAGLDVFLVFTGRELPDSGDLHAQVAKAIAGLLKRHGHGV